jgi:GNAT superfamily N-acetyltransferase
MSDGSPAAPQWRPMIAADLPVVDDLSARIHPDFPERPEVLAEKFRLFPRGCFVLDQAGARICGYCFSHPWLNGPPPALDTLFGALPDAPTGYFIHDMTVEAFLRRRNFASVLVPQLVDIARGLPVDRMMLVAVSGSEPFWTRMGFRRIADPTLQAATRDKYGAGAVQMERELVVRC